MAVQMGLTPRQEDARKCHKLGIESIEEIEEETPIDIGNLEKELNALSEGRGEHDLLYIRAYSGLIYMQTRNKLYANIGFKHLRLRHKRRSKKDYGIEMTFLSGDSEFETTGAIYLKSKHFLYTETPKKGEEAKEIALDYMGFLIAGKFKIIFNADNEHRDSYVTGYKLKEQPAEGK